MPENERALSKRILELEDALSAQHEGIESLRWARAQLERALQRVSQERDEARAEASRLHRLLEQSRVPEEGAVPGSETRNEQPTVRLHAVLAAPPIGANQNGAPTVPAPPRERAPSLKRSDAKDRAADSGTYSVQDVTEEQVLPTRPRRRGAH